VEAQVRILGKERQFCDMGDCGNLPSLSEQQNRAIEELVRFGPAVVPALMPYWKYDGEALRSNLLRTFARIGGADAKQMIFAALANPSFQVRKSAIEGMAALQPLPPEAVPRLFSLLEDREVWFIALRELARLAPTQKPATQQALLKKLGSLLQAKDTSKQGEAVDALGTLAPDFPSAVSLLLRVLETGEPSLRMRAAALLLPRKEHTDKEAPRP
jgi:HEAT repeat protein